MQKKKEGVQHRRTKQQMKNKQKGEGGETQKTVIVAEISK
jgi:hypothetical protein